MKNSTLEEKVRELLRRELPEQPSEKIDELVKKLLSEFEREFLKRSIPLVERVSRRKLWNS